MQLPMPQQQQSHHQVDQDNQAANALLRERFLNFLASMPGQQANVKMFGADVSGTVLGVDARGFEHLLMADLRTPTGPVDRAALRTRDCLFLQVPWPSGMRSGSDNGNKGSQVEVEVESAGIVDEEAGDKELPDLPDFGGCEMEEENPMAADSGESQTSVAGDGDFDRIGDAGGRRGSGSGASTPNTILTSGSSKRMSVASRMLRSSGAVTAIHFPSADHFFGQFSGAGGK